MKPVGGIAGVCFLKANRKFAVVLDQTASATGVLLDGRYVLTAGHNLFNASYPWGRVERIGVEIGKAHAGEAEVVVRGGKVEQGVIPAGGVWTVSPSFKWSPSTWLKPAASNEMIQHDYGFVDLGEGFRRSSHFTLSKGFQLKVGDVVRVAGYPGDSKRVKGATGTQLFEGKGQVTAVGGNLFSYNIVTAKGLSGAPVWVERGGRKVVVGVHVGSDFGGKKGAVARTVNRRLIQDWKAWKSLRSLTEVAGEGALVVAQ